MSSALLAWTAAGALAAVVAVVRLLGASNQPEPSVKNGYRWFAVAAACWGIGGVAQATFGGLIGGASPLRVADLVSLAAWPALVIGVATLTGRFAEPDRADGGPESIPVSAAQGIVMDSCLLVAALFVIGWVTVFGPDYTAADVSGSTFAFDLIRPMADLLALGMVLPFAVRRLRLTLLPTLAIAVVAVSDSLAVGARSTDLAPGVASQLAWIAGLCLLAAAPAALTEPTEPTTPAEPGRPQRLRGRWPEGSWSSPATLTALGAAAAAALVVTGFSLGGGPVASPALAVAGAVVVLVLVTRLAGLARQSTAVAATAQKSDRMFRALADTTSDVVVVCDPAGSIRYVSPAIAELGYQPAQLAGSQLADLVHPQDRLAALRAALTVLRSAAGTDGAAFSGRVRSADGSWRHVESTLSRYSQADGPARLLVTARDVSDRIALRRQVTHLTFHDGLTGLPNRAFVEDQVKDLAGHGEPAQGGPDQGGPDQGRSDPDDLAVIGAILIDLDGYTAVNDLIGPGGGDLLLAQAGRRLRAAAPPQATVARWGGDEFAILVTDCAAAREVVDLAERLAARIAAEPFIAADREIPLTASVGVALTPASTAGHLLSNADVAMSRAKEAGGGRVAVFAPQMHDEVLRRLELTAELRQAISRRQLEIEYQPIVDLASSRVVCVEALLRWSRDGEPASPQEFLRVAEDSGLIVSLGDWALREACRSVAAWHASGWQIGLSVNFSVRQLSAPGFAVSVLGALDEAGLPPEALTIEVTERVLIDSAAPTIAELARLRDKGIKLAIDDFGTSYASLAYLRQLAVDIIKIDPSLVAGLGSDPTAVLLTKTTVGVGHDLGIEVVAEGIEAPEQLDQLRAMGCDLGQGFAVARPMAAREVAAMAAAQADAPACSPVV